jgi:hypothetical protein
MNRRDIASTVNPLSPVRINFPYLFTYIEHYYSDPLEPVIIYVTKIVLEIVQYVEYMQSFHLSYDFDVLSGT